MNEEAVTLDPTGRARKMATIIYALQATSFIFGLTAIIGIILNYLKADLVKGTFVESHFRWQRRTFWFGLFWSLLGCITFAFVIGYFILILSGIWLIYRIVNGWLKLSENRPMYLR
ncbi:hypothetical protein C2E25_03175 [Geothermobacter hydrogeniphilus]|uniref:Transmembrane protein n=1 Tax=Geothermobacter hydrogeniphilus TaxID=1969733 RepID=A0A2K2HDE1_9BACT|nr:hypothetical protein [Geothermobacter hydrogeniphilus]PNU21308.1 hypothetical protein C2E25_03175 [Geothermobacter hydrogeniphilus]